MSEAPALTARTIAAIDDVDAAQWNALAAASEDAGAPNPFIRWEFLQAMEASGSARPETGWAPAHLILEREGALVGAAPLYVKGHSQGEFIFDHHWADAYQRHIGGYYPKLLCAAPFTPAQGPRLLARDDAQRIDLARALIAICARMESSSVHVNFVESPDRAALARAGFLMRVTEQFHWFNRDYQSYEEFLAALASRKRKAIRRERREARESGLRIARKIGDEILESDWDAFWRFYQDTGARKWGAPYLTRTAFRLIAELMGDAALLVLAYDGSRAVAGALNLIGERALYGRYWGCLERHRFLHFELCYHQAIEFAIERGLARVEAGAQGDHKVARGYEPVEIHSAHWIADPQFRAMLAAHLSEERERASAEIDGLRGFTPFRKEG